MNQTTLREILEQVVRRQRSVDEAVETLQKTFADAEDLGFACLDHHRVRRRGHPEVIYCASKSPAQVAGIFAKLAFRSPQVLATRAAPSHAQAVVHEVGQDVRYDAASGALWLDREPARPRHCGPLIIAAGTSDIPVSEEARITLDLMGYQSTHLYDIGVAGLHRLTSRLSVIREARVIIVAAGMEGALPSVVAGLVAAPVIAVPTSVGYGASFGGVAALLGMLNSCSPGVAVVNIDNGFGAGYLAASILDAHRRDVDGDRT